MIDSSTDRWQNLATFPSVNGKAAAFIVLVAATFLNDALMAWGVLLWQAAHPLTLLQVPSFVESLHDAWLFFLAAFGGISLGAFGIKRKTYASPSPDSERADVPAEPPPAAPAPASAVRIPASPPALTAPATTIGATVEGDGD